MYPFFYVYNTPCIPIRIHSGYCSVKLCKFHVATGILKSTFWFTFCCFQEQTPCVRQKVKIPSFNVMKYQSIFAPLI